MASKGSGTGFNCSVQRSYIERRKKKCIGYKPQSSTSYSNQAAKHGCRPAEPPTSKPRIHSSGILLQTLFMPALECVVGAVPRRQNMWAKASSRAESVASMGRWVLGERAPWASWAVLNKIQGIQL